MVVTKKRSTRLRKRSRKSYRRDKQSRRSPPRSTSKIWLLLLMMFFSTQYVASAGLLDQEFNDVYLAGDYPDGSALEAARFRRETNKLNTALQTLQPLARVTNGIALEIGLVTGDFKSEDVVRELLHMGQLTIKDVTDLKKDSIEKVLAALKKGEAVDKGVTDLENRLVSLEDMREIIPKLGGLTEVAGQKEYEDSLAKVKDLENLKANLNTIKTSLNQLVPTLEALKADSEKIPDSITDFTNFAVVTMQTGKLETAAKSFATVTAALSEAKKIPAEPSFLKILLVQSEFLEDVRSTKIDYKNNMPLLLASFSKVRNGSQTVTSASKEFESIRHLAQSRGPSHRQLFHLTSGFPLGLGDFKNLDRSSGESSFVDRVGSNVEDGLREAFKPFKPLQAKLEQVASDWNRLKDPSVNSLLDVVFQLNQISSSSSNANAIAEKLQQCQEKTSSFPQPALDQLTPLAKSAKELRETVSKISDFGYISDFSKLDGVKKLFNTEKLNDDQKKALATATLAKWNTDTELKKFVSNVGTFQTDLASLITLVNNPTQGVDMKIVNDHLATLGGSQDYGKFLNCVKGVQAEGHPVKDLIKYIRDSRSFSVPSNANEVFTSVIDSQGSLNNAQSLAGKFKNNADLSSEATALKTAFGKNSYKDVSQNLGMGVQGLLAIQKARNANLGELVGNADDIVNAAEHNGLTTDQQTSLKQLKAVKGVLSSIDNFLKTTRRRRAANGFQEFQKIFTDAQNVKGTTLDMKTLREAMDTLNKLALLAPAAMSQLDDLEALDLDFARFQMANAVGSLKAMDDFFMSYAQHLAATKAPPPLQSNPQSGRPMAMVATEGPETTTESPFYEKTWFYIVCAVVGIVAVIITIVIIYCCCCKPKVPRVVEPLPDVEDGLSTIGAKLEKPAETPVDPVKSTAATTGAGPTDQPTGDAQPSGTAPGTSTGPAADAPQGGTAPGTSTGPTVDDPKERKSPQLETTQPDPAVPDDSVLNLVKNCTQAIVKNARYGKSPRVWAEKMFTSLNETCDLMINTADGKLGIDERRHGGVYCIARTMAQIADFENLFIHCNEFVFNGKKLFASQGPMDGTEGKGKKDTRAKHMAMIHQNNIGLTVQLCQLKETDKKTGVETVKCAEYYSEEVGKTIHNGQYAVKTVGRRDNLEQFTDKKNFVLFNLESTDTKTGKMHKMDTLLYKGWVDHGAPSIPDPVLEILKFMDTCPKSVLVHCSAGIGRTGSIIATKYGIELCQNKIVDAPNEIISHIRSIRYGCVQTYEQYLYVILCVTKGVMLARGIEFCAEYYEMEYYYQQVLKEVYDHPDLLIGQDEEEKKETEEVQTKINGRIRFLKADYKLMNKYVAKKETEYKAAKKAKEAEQAKQAKQQAEEQAKKAKEVEQAAKETEKKPSSTMSGKKSKADGSKKSGKKSKDGSKKLAKKDKSKTSDVQKPGKKKDRSKQSKEAKSKIAAPAKNKKKKGSKSTPSKEKGGAK